METVPETDRLRTRAFLTLCALVLLPLCLLGYGSDNDTYTALDAGRSTWHFHIANTSRHPGYWLFEAIIFVLAKWSGFVATNLATLAVAIACLWRFKVIATRIGVRFRLLLAGTLAAVPVFVIAATSTVDYLWSLLGLVVFVELLLAERLALAVLPAAFAFAIRGANGILIAAAILAALVSTRNWRLLLTGLAAAILGGLPYIESWRIAGHSFTFLHALAGPAQMWSPAMHLGRFTYKSLYLFGPVALLILAAATAVKPQPATQENPAATRIAAAIVIANLLLFLAYPIEISYLLPAAFWVLLLLGRTLLARSRAIAVAFLLATLSLNLITPQLAAPDHPGQATAAHLQPSLSQGILTQDIRSRIGLRPCDNYPCFFLHLHPESGLPGYTGPKP